MKPELYYPVKPFSVNQPFGANANAFYAQQGMKGHNGLDLFAKHGQPVYAACGGTCWPEVDDHGGNGVLIRTDKFQYVYWHLIQDDAVVHTGQVVEAGDLIGYADNTGTSTGDHLHFGVVPLPADVNNGYKGAIDPQPFFNGKYAEDIKNPPVILKYQFTAVLRLKAWSNDVKQLQVVLKAQGLYNGAIDGIFGAMTEKAVVQFQVAHGLAGDGIVGPKTNAVLNTFL